VLLNAYCTHRDPPPLAFPHVLRARRDPRNPELAKHLNGFQGFVMGGGSRSMTATRYAVLRHIERVHHHVALEVEPGAMGAFAAWAERANAIVLLPDGAVCAPGGAVLVAPDTGDPRPGAAIPYLPDSSSRKRRTDEELARRGIRVLASLPPVVSEDEVELRDPSEVASRCLALFICAARAESLDEGDPLSVADLQTRFPLAFASMSPRERSFMSVASPPRQQIVNHAWQYEALAALVWALGLQDELPFPTLIADVPALARLFVPMKAEPFVAGARLRPVTEVLDALDLTYRLHWAVAEARVQKTPPPASLEPGVVLERHRALNWLTRFHDADWDDVDTPT
jgi:hypothetical protein